MSIVCFFPSQPLETGIVARELDRVVAGELRRRQGGAVATEGSRRGSQVGHVLPVLVAPVQGERLVVLDDEVPAGWDHVEAVPVGRVDVDRVAPVPCGRDRGRRLVVVA